MFLPDCASFVDIEASKNPAYFPYLKNAAKNNFFLSTAVKKLLPIIYCC